MKLNESARQKLWGRIHDSTQSKQSYHLTYSQLNRWNLGQLLITNGGQPSFWVPSTHVKYQSAIRTKVELYEG